MDDYNVSSEEAKAYYFDYLLEKILTESKYEYKIEEV
jgi:hypothetical protein